MWKFLKEWIAKYKQRRQEKTAACAKYISRVSYLRQEQGKLFEDAMVAVNPQASATWQEYTDAFLAECNDTQLRTLFSAKGFRNLKKELAGLKTQRNCHDDRVLQHNQLVDDNYCCQRFLARANDLLEQHRKLFQDELEFIEPEEGNRWAVRLDELRRTWNSLPMERMRLTKGFSPTIRKIADLSETEAILPRQIQQHNNRVAEKRAQMAYDLIGNVEGRKLDSQQLNCIVKKAHNHLVIAGAGTGKTTTVVGKIKYLLRSKQCTPADILVLSFTNASAAEMKQRIQMETRTQIEASTFHKLGLNIITKTNGIMPKITQLSLRKFVREQLQAHMRSDAYLQILCKHLLYFKVDARTEFEFDTKAAYEEYLRNNPPKTLKDEEVKSYGELEIANFLAFNGIPYIYEYPYEIDTRTQEYAQYYPDFYLPEHKIYIEFFGVDRNGNVPAFFSGKNGKSASQSYRESMEWKRKLHKENGTVMLECYAYEKMEGTLEENLARQLQANGVELHPQSAQELWSQITKKDDTVLEGIAELFETIINLMKSNMYTIDDLRRRNEHSGNSSSINAQLWLLEPIYRDYVQYLREHDEIDFNDMINLATRYVAEGKYQNPYSYVIVDEYQDISKARYRLLRALRESRDYELFCVGDDWQSIYRFAGSDIGYILNFSQYWGASEESKIETTYRFNQSLIEISGNFVMRNPAQKRKAIRSKSAESGFALSEVNAYTEKYAVEFLVQKLEDFPKGSTVFFIGRYSFDRRILEESGLFDVQYNNATGLHDVAYSKRPDLKITYMTAHKSKGLQADYVVILNNKSGRMGFPSTIQDGPILDMLLEKTDDYPRGEERRLFYVALTRAKKKAILLTVKDRESVFVAELRERYQEEMKREQFTCPLCGGRLIRRSGRYGDFFGCSNYQSGQCRYTRNIRWATAESEKAQ